MLLPVTEATGTGTDTGIRMGAVAVSARLEEEITLGGYCRVGAGADRVDNWGWGGGTGFLYRPEYSPVSWTSSTAYTGMGWGEIQ